MHMGQRFRVEEQEKIRRSFDRRTGSLRCSKFVESGNPTGSLLVRPVLRVSHKHSDYLPPDLRIIYIYCVNEVVMIGGGHEDILLRLRGYFSERGEHGKEIDLRGVHRASTRTVVRIGALHVD